MALINRPMYEQFGARHLGVKGPGALTNLEEGVMGTLPLDMSADPAYWFIQGIRVFSATVYQAGTTGTYAAVGLSVETSNQEILCRILSIDMRQSVPVGSPGDYTIGRCARSAFSSDPGIYGYATDTRTAEGQHSQGIILNGSIAAVPGQSLGAFYRASEGDVIHAVDWPFIVSPGQCIYVQQKDADTHAQVGIIWAEIPAYKAEL